jgi:lipid-A-disaccharide synthase-like uncharacterized protein
MDRETIIAIVDVVLQIAALLFVLLCAKKVFFALRNKYVFINSQKATRTEEPLGYWLMIVSWIGVSAVFAYVFVSSF